MSVKTVFATFTSFLAHHVVDLNNVADALGSVVGSLPLDPQLKTTINNTVAEIRNSVDNINEWLNHPPAPADVTLKESDIIEALANFFATDAGKAALAAALPPASPPSNSSAEGNANG